MYTKQHKAAFAMHVDVNVCILRTLIFKIIRMKTSATGFV